MTRRIRFTVTLLALAFACSSPEPRVATAPTPPTTEQPAAAQAPTPVRATPELARRAADLQHRLRPLDALELLLTELSQRLAAREWSDPWLVADSIIAAQSLEFLLAEVAAWRPTLERLEAAKPFPADTPPELAAQLDRVLARALVRAERYEEALQLTRAGGALTDWRIVGPFANERGSGFDTAYEPEKQLDYALAMRGKERDVAWRAHPTPQQPLATVVLSDLMRPNEQSIAYLASAVRVDEPREVVLSLASSGALKVWHGEQLVHANKVHRPFRRDQDRVVLALHEGWNRLLIKVGVEERVAWLFTARLTELDGRPLTEWRHDSLQAPGAPMQTAAASATPAADVAARLAELAASAASDAERARALELLAMHHLHVHPDDTAAQTAKKHAEAALALTPDDPFALYLAALANEPEPGASLSEVRQNERLAPLKRLVALDAGHAGAHCDLAQFYRDSNPIPRLADEHSRRALELAPASYAATKLRAAVLAAADRDAESTRLEELADELLEAQWRPEAVLRRAAWRNWREGHAAERRELEQALARGVNERDVVVALLGHFARQDDFAAYAATAQRWLARAPHDVDWMLRAARVVELGGDLDGAAALAEQARAVCPDDAVAARALARVAQRRNDLASADRWLAESLRLDPGYDKARRQREVLLQQGEDRFETPFRWDALERVGASPPVGADNELVQVVDRTRVWRVNDDGSEHMYEHVLLRIGNTGGVKALDKYWIGYPSDSTLQVYNVRVVRPDGSFERAPPPRGRDASYGPSYARFFDLPALNVGDWVDIEYRIDQRQADVFGMYFGARHSFYADHPDTEAPVARSELVVVAPPDVPIYFKAHNAASLEHLEERGAGGERIYRWIARDLKRPTPQAWRPDAIEHAPTVDVSTYESWEAFAGWWWSFIEKEFVTTQAMKDKVRELTAGLSSEMDKIRAITRFVGQEIRYNAWSFGTHGYEPFSAATIFERRFGDCKDKSILLRQMLAEIGVESHPVLINAQARRPEEKLDIAMVGHFNHCIAYVRPTAERAGFYLDATADRNPIEYLREDDQGAKVLHVDAREASIERIEYTPAPDNALRRVYDVALDADGRGVVALVDESVGAFGVRLRYQFGGETGDLRERVAESLGGSFGKVEVREVSTSQLEDIGAPARLSTRFEAAGLWTREGGGATLRLGFDPLPLLDSAREPAAEREWELVFDRPMQFETTVRFSLPAGVSLASTPPDVRIGADGLVEYEMTTAPIDGGVEVRRRYTLHARRVALERYEEFQDTLREIRAAEERTLGLRTGPVEASSKETK